MVGIHAEVQGTEIDEVQWEAILEKLDRHETSSWAMKRISERKFLRRMDPKLISQATPEKNFKFCYAYATNVSDVNSKDVRTYEF